MVYNAKTYEVCHKLSKEGEERYRDLLEHAADEILFKHKHPFKWMFQKVISFFKDEK